MAEDLKERGVDVVNSVKKWEALGRVTDTQPGDILIKKVFSDKNPGVVERAIVGAQSMFQEGETINLGTDHQRSAFLGDKSSEHIAVAVGDNRIAEADGAGIGQHGLGERAHERYVVFRPKNDVLAGLIGGVAAQMAVPRGPQPRGGNYSLFGAMKSSFRSAINSSERRTRTLESGLRYLNCETNERPNMFCSEFAAACIEIAGCNVPIEGQAGLNSSLGVSPRAVSPMVLENLLNQRPDLFNMVGRYNGNPIESDLKTG